MGVREASPSLSRRPSLVANHRRHRGDSGAFLGLGTPPPGPSEPLTSRDGLPPSTATQLPMCGWGAGQRPAAFLLTLDCPGPSRQALGVGAAARGQRDGPKGGSLPAPGRGGGPIGAPAALPTGGGCPAGPCRPGRGHPGPSATQAARVDLAGVSRGQVLTRGQAQTFQRRRTQANASWLCLESH